MKAIWNGQTIAESGNTVVVEGNHYFPRESVKTEYLAESATHSTCPWKGEASYFSLKVGGQENRDAAMATSFGLSPEIDWLYGENATAVA